MASIYKPTNRSSYSCATLVLASLVGASILGCGGGGGSGSAAPPAPEAPAPPPVVPPPAPPPPPPPAPTTPPETLPPQAATPIDLNDNHMVGAAHWEDGDTGDGGTGQPVAGFECNLNADETYHVHTHLSIFMNGEALAVPQEIGIADATPTTHCFYTIHTHDRSGKIHVEAPAPGTFTLGQLFAIWGQTLDTTNVAGITGMPIVVYVTDAGVVTKATGDWHDIELKSHREVTIQIGTPITEIPNFSWSAN